MSYKFGDKLLQLCECGHTRQQPFPKYLDQEVHGVAREQGFSHFTARGFRVYDEASSCHIVK